MGAPNATTTIVTQGIQGPPGGPPLSTTLIALATMPAVSNTVTVQVASIANAAVGAWVTIAGLGSLQIVSYGANALTLLNTGASGNATVGTTASAGAIVQNAGAPGPSGAAGSPGTPGANGTNAYTLLNASFTQPAASSSVTVQVGSSTWMAVGQYIYVAGGGVYTVASTPSGTTVSLTNTGANGNVSPGGTVSSGGLVVPSGAPGPAGAAGGVQVAGDIGGTNAAPTVIGVSGSGGNVAYSATQTTLPSAGHLWLLGTSKGLSVDTTHAWMPWPIGNNGLVLSPVFNAGGSTVAAMATDSSGDLFLGSDNAYSLATMPNIVGVTGGTSVQLNYRNSTKFAVNSSGNIAYAPIIGDSSSSPYGVHGVSVTNVTGSRNATSAEYAMGSCVFNVSSAATVTFPAPSSNALGYSKLIVNTGTFTLTVSTGTGTTQNVAPGSRAVLAFSTAGVS